MWTQYGLIELDGHLNVMSICSRLLIGEIQTTCCLVFVVSSTPCRWLGMMLYG